MTLLELKEKVSESENSEWFQNYELKLNYPQINTDLSFKGLVAIYEFVLKQIEGFSVLENLPVDLVQVSKAFKNVKIKFVELLKQNTIRENEWKNVFTNIKNTNPKIFLYDSPETYFLIKLNKENPSFYSGAYQYLTGSIPNLASKEYFIGYLLAYEFSSKNYSEITNRKEAEEKSISKIRADFQKKLSDAEVHMTGYLADANKQFEEYSKLIDNLKKQKEENYNTWFNKTSNDFTTFTSNASKQITDLEELYKAKLKLEAPAKYWSDRAKKLRVEGYWWLGGLMITILIGVGILIWILNGVTEGNFETVFSNTGSAIKWSVALITIISFIAFGIKTLSKLTFSSFHLVRDAEEREQLTYVYLALQKEKGIDQTERHLIMQSLFSRADSGLLKDDSSPTMPGNIVDKIMKG